MSRALSKAQTEATRAVADVDQWMGALAAAEAAQVSSEALDPASVEDLDAVAAAAAGASARVAAARRALQRAQARLADARRGVLVAEARDEDDVASQAERELQQHSSKLRAVLSQLQALEGVEFRPVTADSTWDERRFSAAGAVVYAVPRSEQLQRVVELHRTRAAVLRATAQGGAVPSFAAELDYRRPGVWAAEPLSGDLVPASALEYAGWVASVRSGGVAPGAAALVSGL